MKSSSLVPPAGKSSLPRILDRNTLYASKALGPKALSTLLDTNATNARRQRVPYRVGQGTGAPVMSSASPGHTDRAESRVVASPSR